MADGLHAFKLCSVTTLNWTEKKNSHLSENKVITSGEGISIFGIRNKNCVNVQVWQRGCVR